MSRRSPTEYSLKTDTHHGAILAQHHEHQHKSTPHTAALYRAVEYTKSPHLEKVSVKTSPGQLNRDLFDSDVDMDDHDRLSEQNIIIHHNQNQIETTTTTTTTATATAHSSSFELQQEILNQHIKFHNEQYSKYGARNNETYQGDEENEDKDEKTFIVKLFPLDEQEKEVQELTMTLHKQ